MPKMKKLSWLSKINGGCRDMACIDAGNGDLEDKDFREKLGLKKILKVTGVEYLMYPTSDHEHANSVSEIGKHR